MVEEGEEMEEEVELLSFDSMIWSCFCREVMWASLMVMNFFKSFTSVAFFFSSRSSSWSLVGRSWSRPIHVSRVSRSMLSSRVRAERLSRLSSCARSLWLSSISARRCALVLLI